MTEAWSFVQNTEHYELDPNPLQLNQESGFECQKPRGTPWSSLSVTVAWSHAQRYLLLISTAINKPVKAY